MKSCRSRLRSRCTGIKNFETENNFVNVNAEFAEVDDDDEGKTAKKKIILGMLTEGEKRGWRWKAEDR